MSDKDIYFFFKEKVPLMIWWTLVSFRLYRNWKIYKERKGKEKNRYVDDRYVEE